MSPRPEDITSTVVALVSARTTRDDDAVFAIIDTLTEEELRASLFISTALLAQVAEHAPGGVPYFLDVWRRWMLGARAAGGDVG